MYMSGRQGWERGRAPSLAPGVTCRQVTPAVPETPSVWRHRDLTAVVASAVARRAAGSSQEEGVQPTSPAELTSKRSGAADRHRDPQGRS